jgi:hypothetical protein
MEYGGKFFIGKPERHINITVRVENQILTFPTVGNPCMVKKVCGSSIIRRET